MLDFGSAELARDGNVGGVGGESGLEKSPGAVFATPKRTGSKPDAELNRNAYMFTASTNTAPYLQILLLVNRYRRSCRSLSIL